MRALRPLLVVLLPVVAAAGCIPSRDNPYDPSLAPVASLVVKVNGLETQIGGISSVFELDASGSRDNGGSGTPEKIEFEIDEEHSLAPDVSDEDFNYAPSPESVHTLVLSSGFLATPGVVLLPEMFDGPGGTGASTNRVFKVRVTGHNGHEAIATVAVRIENTAPSVPSVDVFVAAQGAPPIVLDACDGNALSGCAATDPDGDPLTYTWTRESGDDGILLQPLDPTDESNRRMVFTPVGKRGWEFRVTANDGLADSVSGRFRVFRSGAFWAGMSQPGQLTRVYPDFLVRDSWRDRFGVLTSFSPDSFTPHVAADGEGRIWLAVIDSSSTLVRMDSSLDAKDPGFSGYTLPGGVSFYADDTFPAIAPFEGGACVLAADTNGFQVHRVVEPGTATVVLPLALPPSEIPVLLPEGPASCVVVDTQVVRLDASGSTALAPTVTFEGPKGAVLDEDGALWVIEQTGGNMGARFVYYLPLTATAPTAVAFDFPMFADEILAHPSGEGVLLHSNDGKFVHAVADPAETDGFRVVQEVTRGLDDVDALGDILLASDSVDGALWYVDPGTYDLRRWIFRNETWEDSGRVPIADIAELGSETQWVSLGIDGSTGRAIALTRSQGGASPVRLSQVPPHLHRVQSVPFTLGNSQRLSIDPASGSVWYSDCDLTDPAGHYCPDGKGLARVDANGRITVQSSSLTMVTAQPDGGAWVVDGDLVVRDLDRDGVEDGPSFTLPVVAQDAALGDDGTLCVATRSLPPISGGNFGEGPAARIAGGTLTVFPEVLECARQAIAGADGDCWFVGQPTGECDNTGNPSDRTRILHYAAGSSVPDIDFAPGKGQGTKLLIDPRPGQNFWLVDPNTSTTQRFDLSLVSQYSYSGSVGAFGLVRLRDVCITADCLETWRTEGPFLLRGTADLSQAPLETIPLAATGSVEGFQIVPYVFLDAEN